MAMNKRRGRPPLGTRPAREQLLEAGTRLFPEYGYEATTLRMLADAAGCDPALVAYHFGSKSGLFAQVTAVLLGPAEIVERALPGPKERLGQRLVDQVMAAWEDPESGARLARLVHAALTDPEVVTAFREYVDVEISHRLVEYFGGGVRGRDQTASVLTLVVGVIFGRYIVRTEALTQMSAERYRRAIAPQAVAAVRVGPRRR